MENLRTVPASVEIMNEIDAAFNNFDDVIQNTEVHGEEHANSMPSDTEKESVRSFQCSDCNDGERAILHGFISLMQHCIELAEKVGTAKA